MFGNHLRSAIRYVSKNKGYSFLNFFGLAIGIACAGLIFLWVEDELKFDSNHLKKDRLYLVKVNVKLDAGIFTHSSTPGPLSAMMQQQLPGIANTCRMTEEATPKLFRIGDKALYASGKYAEPSVFSMFTLPFVQGNPSTAFSELYSLVITEKTAKKFFGTDPNVIGRTFKVDYKQDYVVTGVVKDLPENSTLQFEWLAPLQIYVQQNPWLAKWNNFGLTTYLELKPGVNPAAINKTLSDPLFDFTIGKKDISPSTDHIFLFGMENWHLRDQFAEGILTGGGRIQYVRLFSTIAWIILFIACINFMNLATARSEKRSREVGVRKVLGAAKGSLVGQFIGEALFMAFLSMIGGLITMSLVLPAFDLLVQKHLSLGLNQPLHWIAMLLLTLVCGLVAGSYPAVYLSSFSPVYVLKGINVRAGGGDLLRKGLVVLQFAVSIVLIIGTIIIYQQISHVKDRNLGFNKDHLIQITLQGGMQKNFAAIRQEFIRTGSVQNVTLADHQPLADGNNTGGISWPGKDPNSQIVISQRVSSKEFMSTLGMHIKEGRDFESTDNVEMNRDGGHRDSSQIFHVLITASMERLLGQGSAVGKTMEYHSNFGDLQMVVVGVVEDYVYGNIYGREAAPVIFYCIPNATSLMYVRTSSQSSPEEALAKMKAVLKKLNSGYPFEYAFVDDQFNAKFFSEMLISKLSRVFAVLAILISCLGLFGLAAHTAERRTKEIGIRKVLGATTRGITSLLSKDFLQLVLIACAIAFPAAWLVMNHWLKDYAYRIQISWWVFAVGGVMAMAIALSTISFQAIKAAMANPVNSLRAE